MYGRTLALNFKNGASGIVSVAFDSSGGGNFTLLAGGAGTVTGYSWTQDPYRGWLWPIVFSDVVPAMTLTLNFNTATGGAFSGTAYPYYPYSFGAYSVSGTLSLTGP